jgi:hypothetical protein
MCHPTLPAATTQKVAFPPGLWHLGSIVHAGHFCNFLTPDKVTEIRSFVSSSSSAGVSSCSVHTSSKGVVVKCCRVKAWCSSDTGEEC